MEIGPLYTFPVFTQALFMACIIRAPLSYNAPDHTSIDAQAIKFISFFIKKISIILLFVLLCVTLKCVESSWNQEGSQNLTCVTDD